MSYFADVRCPKCGKIKQLHLGGLGFYGHDKEHCNYCGFDFDPQINCQSMEVDRDCLSTERTNTTKEVKNYRLEVDLLRIENEKLKRQVEELKRIRQ